MSAKQGIMDAIPVIAAFRDSRMSEVSKAGARLPHSKLATTLTSNATGTFVRSQ
jgi:hypothetical protein